MLYVIHNCFDFYKDNAVSVFKRNKCISLMRSSGSERLIISNKINFYLNICPVQSRAWNVESETLFHITTEGLLLTPRHSDTDLSAS